MHEIDVKLFCNANNWSSFKSSKKMRELFVEDYKTIISIWHRAWIMLNRSSRSNSHLWFRPHIPNLNRHKNSGTEYGKVYSGRIRWILEDTREEFQGHQDDSWSGYQKRWIVTGSSLQYTYWQRHHAYRETKWQNCQMDHWWKRARQVDFLERLWQEE